MSVPFKGIDQSSDQNENSIDGTSSSPMAPYNTIEGYSDLNEDF